MKYNIATKRRDKLGQCMIYKTHFGKILPVPHTLLRITTDDNAAMMILVPFYRRCRPDRYNSIIKLRDRLKAKGCALSPWWSMKSPFQQFQSHVSQDILPGISLNLHSMSLNTIDHPAIDDGLMPFVELESIK